jgi:hypothetical protein
MPEIRFKGYCRYMFKWSSRSLRFNISNRFDGLDCVLSCASHKGSYVAREFLSVQLFRLLHGFLSKCVA